MRRAIALVALACCTLFAQAPATSNLTRLAGDLDAAIQAGDWAKAVDISHTLKVAAIDARDASLSGQGSELAENILAWLPVDTETYVVAQRPFKLPEGNIMGVPSILDEARGFVLGLLFAPEKGKLAEALIGRTIRLAAIGRRFGAEPEETPPPNTPVPLGMVPYQACGVYAFAEPPGERIFGRPPDSSVLGMRVWVSKGSQNDTPDRETYEVAFLKPDVIMSCNNHAFFEQMAARMSAPAPSRALPSSLPEWKYVNRTAPLWALCHYTEKTAGLAHMGSEHDPHATGISVEFGSDGQSSKAFLLAASNPWEGLGANPEFPGTKVGQTVPGVWELSAPDHSPAIVLLFMAYLGFVVLI
jgi:hypothetical protein